MTDVAVLADGIAAHGVRHIFGVPGSGVSLSLADALERRGVTFVRTQFEGAAAMMAGTVGRLTGRAGVALSIKGPGLANMVPGLALSWFESFPMIAVCEAFPSGSPPARAHKAIDQRTLTQALSKGRRRLSERGPGFGELAAWAEAERPAPVLLEVTGTVIDSDDPVPRTLYASGEPDALLAAIRSAKRPAVIAGSLAIRRGWEEKLNGLRIPTFTTAAAKGAVDESLMHAAGVYTGVGLDYAPESSLLASADVVVGFGLRAQELLAVKNLGRVSVNVDPVKDIPGTDAFGFAAVCGTEGALEVLETLAHYEWGIADVQAAWQRLDDHMRARGAFLPVHAFAALAQHFGKDVRLVMDTGYFCTIGEHAWRAQRPDRCLFSGQGRYMGAGVPMAIGAAIIDGSVPTVAVLGDGGIGPFIGEVRLAMERRLPLLFLLMTDGRFASIRTRALKDGLTQSPLTIGDPSWVGPMQGFGMPVWKAIDEDSLHRALCRWQPAAGPAYIEVAFEPDVYQRMIEGIR